MNPSDLENAPIDSRWYIGPSLVCAVNPAPHAAQSMVPTSKTVHLTIGEQNALKGALLRSVKIVDHPDNAAVDDFAAVMKRKLEMARAKGRKGWQTADPEDLRQQLREHIDKGDPIDVAVYCMFLWHGGNTTRQTPVGINGLTEEETAATASVSGLQANGGKTGWPPGMLQDDHKGLSKWLAGKPDARMRAREAGKDLSS